MCFKFEMERFRESLTNLAAGMQGHREHYSLFIVVQSKTPLVYLGDASDRLPGKNKNWSKRRCAGS